MEEALEIVFRNIERSDYLVNLIQEKAGKLDQVYGHIIDGRVIMELPHKQHQTGNEYHVTIEMNVPGKRLVVSRSPGDNSRHEDPLPTINDAFAAMMRQLEEYERRQRGDVKTHDLPLQGKVSRLFPLQDYGFITMTDGREIYFHAHSVVKPDFENLEVGTPVRVVLAHDESPQGPQATTVEQIGDMQYVAETAPSTH